MSLSLLIRGVWIALGFLAIGLGVLGIVLPLLPTTVFFLLAAFCFARSSRALHDWLVEHPTFGPPIVNWREYRAISRRAKITALTAMVVLLVGGLVFGLSPRILIIQAVVLTGVAIFILSRPSPPGD
ncbi:YbaN family protein [Primorskyibacter aestuariivivens]|uniref:YbaN family protein n=1 Tax=Primorskyibacter aestuariivivens TaxID=1888912 RepID=UPI002FE1CB76